MCCDFLHNGECQIQLTWPCKWPCASLFRHSLFNHSYPFQAFVRQCPLEPTCHCCQKKTVVREVISGDISWAPAQEAQPGTERKEYIHECLWIIVLGRAVLK